MQAIYKRGSSGLDALPEKGSRDGWAQFKSRHLGTTNAPQSRFDSPSQSSWIERNIWGRIIELFPCIRHQRDEQRRLHALNTKFDLMINAMLDAAEANAELACEEPSATQKCVREFVTAFDKFKDDHTGIDQAAYVRGRLKVLSSIAKDAIELLSDDKRDGFVERIHNELWVHRSQSVVKKTSDSLRAYLKRNRYAEKAQQTGWHYEIGVDLNYQCARILEDRISRKVFTEAERAWIFKLSLASLPPDDQVAVLDQLDNHYHVLVKNASGILPPWLNDGRVQVCDTNLYKALGKRVAAQLTEIVNGTSKAASDSNADVPGGGSQVWSKCQELLQEAVNEKLISKEESNGLLKAALALLDGHSQVRFSRQLTDTEVVIISGSEVPECFGINADKLNLLKACIDSFIKLMLLGTNLDDFANQLKIGEIPCSDIERCSKKFKETINAAQPAIALSEEHAPRIKRILSKLSAEKLNLIIGVLDQTILTMLRGVEIEDADEAKSGIFKKMDAAISEILISRSAEAERIKLFPARVEGLRLAKEAVAAATSTENKTQFVEQLRAAYRDYEEIQKIPQQQVGQFPEVEKALQDFKKFVLELKIPHVDRRPHKNNRDLINDINLLRKLINIIDEEHERAMLENFVRDLDDLVK